MNILKPSAMIEQTQYQRLFKHFNFENIFQTILSGVKTYRFFSVSRPDEESIVFTPSNDFFKLSNLNMLAQCLDPEMHSALVVMNDEKRFLVRQKKKILCYLHMDWILCLQHLKEQDAHEPRLIEYLQFETGNKDVVKKINQVNANNESRSNIYTINKNSVLVDLLRPEKSKKLRSLNKKNRELIARNPLLSYIEITNGFENEKLTEFLNLLNNYATRITALHNITDDMRFGLKIRKILRTNKRGMFIVKQNCILLDPRHVDSLRHELGHWYHTWFQREIVDEKEAEKFATEFLASIEHVQ